MTRFLTAFCWTVVLVTLALLLMTGCAPTDPDAMRAEADRIDRAHARATAEAVARHIEQTAQAEAATIEARDQESHEARLILDYAAATVSAIQSDQYRLDLELSAREATLDAWDSSLRVTQTMAGIQATQTVQPTALAAAMQSARARADMMQVAANALPFLALIVILAVVFVVLIGIRWLWMLVEWRDRVNGQVHTRLGLMTYKAGGTLVDRAPLNVPHLPPDPVPAAPDVDDMDDEPVQPPTMRETAIELLERGQEIYGDTTDRIPGWRAAGDGWSSSKWQMIVGYLSSVGIAQKHGSTYHAMPTCADAIYKLETTSPTPLTRVKGGE